MFLELPIAIQERVYDSLPMTDRRNLNIALGKRRIVRTLHNNPEKDRKLAVVNYAFKKMTAQDVKKSKAISKFLMENMEDPTVKDIMKTYMPDYQDTHKAIIDAICSNTLTTLATLQPIPESSFPAVLENVTNHATPDTLHQLVNREFPCLPGFRGYILEHATQDAFAFNLVIKHRHSLLKYIASLDEFSHGIEYIYRNGEIFGKFIRFVETVIQCLHPPPKMIDDMLTTALMEMNLEAIELLTSYIKNGP